MTMCCGNKYQIGVPFILLELETYQTLVLPPMDSSSCEYGSFTPESEQANKQSPEELHPCWTFSWTFSHWDLRPIPTFSAKAESRGGDYECESFHPVLTM